MAETPYNPKDHPFPKVLYHKKHGTKTVHSDVEHAAAAKAGWVATPAVFDPPADDPAPAGDPPPAADPAPEPVKK